MRWFASLHMKSISNFLRCPRFSFVIALTVINKGEVVSDVRRKLMFWKKIKIPILWVLENTSGVCLSSLKCKSQPPKQIYACCLEETPKGAGGTPIHGIYDMFVFWERAWFWGSVSVSLVDVTYNCIHGVIVRQSTCKWRMIIAVNFPI